MAHPMLAEYTSVFKEQDYHNHHAVLQDLQQRIRSADNNPPSYGSPAHKMFLDLKNCLEKTEDCDVARQYLMLVERILRSVQRKNGNGSKPSRSKTRRS